MKFEINTNAQFKTVAALFEQLNFPTSGEAALALWEWSNDYQTCSALAIQAMEALGYRAFAGYPLQRKKANT